MRAQVATFAGCLIPSQIARSQATKKKSLKKVLHRRVKNLLIATSEINKC
jgi:hypothetical protein